MSCSKQLTQVFQNPRNPFRAYLPFRLQNDVSEGKEQLLGACLLRFRRHNLCQQRIHMEINLLFQFWCLRWNLLTKYATMVIECASEHISEQFIPISLKELSWHGFDEF